MLSPRRLVAVLVATLLLSGVLGSSPASAAGGTLEITGGGWGHGIGMSQYGAKGMADAGYGYHQILQYYYSGVGVGTPSPSPTEWQDVRVRLAESDDTISITPSAPVDVEAPDGIKKAGAHTEIRIGHGGDGQRVLNIGGVEQGRYPSSSTIVVRLQGVRATVSPPGRDYRWGDIAVVPNPGVDACRSRNCVIVRNMTMDEYLYGLAEVPSSWHSEALKAQAVAGRSYAAAKIFEREGQAFHLDSTVMDQAYTGWAKEGGPSGDRWVEAVNATHDVIIWNGAYVATAFYSSSSGGHTADNDYVWGGSPLSYLRGKSDPWDATPANPNHSWTRTYGLDEIGSWFGVSGVYHVELTGHIGDGGRTNRADVRIHHAGGVKTVGADSFRNTINARVPWDRQLRSTKWAITNAGFTDVPARSYYTGAVAWAVANGITDGVGNTGRFEPGRSVTRAEVATFLYRFVGASPPTGGINFPDVPTDAFYSRPVRWLSQEGITGGVGNTGLYQPNRPVTRAEFAAMLHRLAKEPAVGTDSGFPDVPASSFFARPVTWLRQLGLTNGYGDSGLYAPTNPVTRAELVVFLERMAETPSAWSRWSPPPPIAS